MFFGELYTVPQKLPRFLDTASKIGDIFGVRFERRKVDKRANRQLARWPCVKLR